ncbi:MAG: tetratricopeptide repeat protein [Acidobacteriota bacterium]
MDVQELERLLGTGLSEEDRLDVLDQLAGHFYDLKDYKKAIQHYEKGEQLASPGNARAYFSGQKGICYYLLQKDERAIQSLLDAKNMFSPAEDEFSADVYGMVHFFLGSYYEYTGEDEPSMQARLEALKFIDELDQEAQWMLLSGLSRNHERRNEHRKALQYNMQAISLIGHNDPEMAYLYESMGNNHVGLGEYEEALSCYSKILSSSPQFERLEEIYSKIGLCYQRLLDYRTALNAYLKLLEVKKLQRTEGESLAWLHIEIAHCHYHLKEYAQALQAARQGLDEPVPGGDDLADLRSYLTSCNHALGNHQEAVRQGEQTLKISESFAKLAEMLPNLALSCYELNQMEKFRFYRDRCNRDFPDSSWTKHLNKLKA